jgi:hypothetical protein
MCNKVIYKKDTVVAASEISAEELFPSFFEFPLRNCSLNATTATTTSAAFLSEMCKVAL